MLLEKNDAIFIYIFEPLFSCLNMLLLGSFYIAIDHMTIVNVLIWSICIWLPYYLLNLFYFIKYKIKKKNIILHFNKWAIFGGYAAIAIISLAFSFNDDEFLYVEIMGSITTFIGTVSLIKDLLVKKKKKEIKTENEKKVLELISNNKTISICQISKNMNLSVNEISKIVRHLKDKAFIQGKTIGKNGMWILNE